MPVAFLTDAERERLARFPAEVPPEDVIAYFTLSAADLRRVRQQRGAQNRLGFAVQLCALRYLGFIPGLGSAPEALVAVVAGQLGVQRSHLARYGAREQTRTEHVQDIQEHLGFRNPDADDLGKLRTWLLERALEHDRPTLLLQLACDRLRDQKLVRPGVTSLEKLVASVRARGERETYHRLGSLLTEERRALLDRMLVRDDRTGRTPLSWLRQGATANNASAILEGIEKLFFLRRCGVDAWNLEHLNPNRLKFLAQVGRRSTNQALARMSAAARYPILVAYMRQQLVEIGDEVVDLFDRAMAQAYSRAGRELDEFRRRHARSTNEKVRLFQEFASILLNSAVSDEDVRRTVFERIPAEDLRAALDESEKLIRPLDDSYFDLLSSRYANIRQFAPKFLDAFEFRGLPAETCLLQAVEQLRQLNADGKRKVPEDASLEFMPAKWRPHVVDEDGHVDRRHYELSVLWELRGALRAGNVWLEGSRRYADPESYLIPRDSWPAQRPEVYRLLKVLPEETQLYNSREAQLERQIVQTAKSLPGNDKVRLEDGQLIISPHKGLEVSDSALKLERLVSERLPKVELTDLLIEVDRWTSFSRHFEHAGGHEPRTKELQVHLYASILGQACNFGLATMANLADLSYQKLAWCSTWYLREETLRSAVFDLVNFQHRRPFSRHWGGGTLSSSDGQRFPVAIPARNATAIPRYFGFGRGFTIYTWTSDQFSQYGSKVIPSTVRDATFVLDAILDNETELPIAEHTTDTAGYTELIFALFDLLGLQFAPRIRDLGSQRLYRVDRNAKYGPVDTLLKGTINKQLILERWEDILRVAGSLKLGWVTASLLVSKLQSVTRRNSLVTALREYGRLVKTLFVLRYLESEDYRRRIGVQLNKGEALHALRRYVFFANAGHLRKHHDDELLNQAGCLNLLTNAVITWNTVYLEAVIKQLRAEGHLVRDEDLVPAGHPGHACATVYCPGWTTGDQRWEGAGGRGSDLPGAARAPAGGTVTTNRAEAARSVRLPPGQEAPGSSGSSMSLPRASSGAPGIPTQSCS